MEGLNFEITMPFTLYSAFGCSKPEDMPCTILSGIIECARDRDVMMELGRESDFVGRKLATTRESTSVTFDDASRSS